MTILASVRPTFLLALVLGAACAGPTERAEKVQRIDDLLARVERVQVDAVVSKEVAQAPYDQFGVLCAPEFGGDAKQAYALILEKIDLSEGQARKLRESIEPMRTSAEAMFRQWTSDLQVFGNARMRQRSQSRLDETQNRYQAVVSSAQSALIAYDAYNADLRDYALFLGHDLNASAVAELAGDLQALGDEVRQLGVRMDTVANAARGYVEAAALYGQAEIEKTAPPESDPKAKPPDGAPTQTKRRPSTLKKRANASPVPAEAAPQSEPASGDATAPSGAPDPGPPPTTNPTLPPGPLGRSGTPS